MANRSGHISPVGLGKCLYQGSSGHESGLCVWALECLHVKKHHVKTSQNLFLYLGKSREFSTSKRLVVVCRSLILKRLSTKTKRELTTNRLKDKEGDYYSRTDLGL